MGGVRDYAPLERALGEVLSACSGRMSPSEEAEVRHFIDVDEYGLAFETLCLVLDEKGVKVSPAAYQAMSFLAKEMNTSEDIWGRVKQCLD